MKRPELRITDLADDDRRIDLAAALPHTAPFVADPEECAAARRELRLMLLRYSALRIHLEITAEGKLSHSQLRALAQRAIANDDECGGTY